MLVGTTMIARMILPKLFTNKVSRVVRSAGIDARGFSGHSCRVGACQNMSIAGMGIHQIMLAGDWDSPDMPAYYARKVAPDKSGMAKLAEIQNQS